MTKLVALAALALAACNSYLSAQSPAPPGRAARLDEVTNWIGKLQSYRLGLSSGAAIAIMCNLGGPCEHLKVTSDDPSIADVRPASLGVLQASSWTNQQTSSALVVIGKKPGTTRVRVQAKEGHRDIAVTIEAPPAS